MWDHPGLVIIELLEPRSSRLTMQLSFSPLAWPYSTPMSYPYLLHIGRVALYKVPASTKCVGSRTRAFTPNATLFGIFIPYWVPMLAIRPLLDIRSGQH